MSKRQVNLFLFFSGVKPPALKKPMSEHDKGYEMLRDRKFLAKWKEEFPWLIFDNAAGKMFYKFCSDSGVNETSNFVSGGAKSFRHDSLNTHDGSELHIRAAQIFQAKQTPKEKSTGGKTVMKLRNIDVEQLSGLFRAAHAMALKGRPFSDFVWMTK